MKLVIECEWKDSESGKSSTLFCGGIEAVTIWAFDNDLEAEKLAVEKRKGVRRVEE